MASNLTPEEKTQGHLLNSDAGGNSPMFVVGGDPDLEKFTRLNNGVYRKYFTALIEDDRYYRQEYGEDLIPAEWKEKGFKATVPPTAYNAVESASDHILTTPDIFVPPRPTDAGHIAEQEIAGTKTLFLESFWHNVYVKGNPLEIGKKKLVKDGRIVLKKTIKWDFVDEAGQGLGVKQFLWDVKTLPNETVLEDPDNPDDPAYVYESYNIRVDSAKRLFPDAKYQWTGKRGDERVRYLEYWTKPAGKSKGQRKVWIDNELVLDKSNPYYWSIGYDEAGKALYDGYVPYIIRSSGWGDTDASNMPHQRYVGILRYMHSTLDTEARQISAADAQLRVTTFPPIILAGISEDEEHKINIGPAAKIFLPNKDTQSVTTLQWPTLDPSVWQIVSRLHSYANDLAKFDQLGGAPQRGVDTATEAGMNVRQAGAKLSGPMNALKTAMMAINEQLFYDVEYILEAPVTLYGASESGPGVVTLTPEQIAGFCMNFVELKTTDQAALDTANMRNWADMYNVFGIDKAYAGGKAGIKNMTERMYARMAEDVNNDPMMHQLRVMMAMSGQGELGKQMAARMMAAMQPPNPLGGGSEAAQGVTTPQPMLPGLNGPPDAVQAAQMAQQTNRPDMSFQ